MEILSIEPKRNSDNRSCAPVLTKKEKKLLNINLNNLLEKLKTTASERLESETIEFKGYQDSKSLFNSSNELVEEIVAMANRKGGLIIIGVLDSSNVSGLWSSQLSGFENVDSIEVSDRLKGKIKPNIDIQIENYQYENKNYLIIKIPLRRDLIFSTSSGKYYIRDNRESRPMAPHEIENHIKSLQSYDWSAQVIELPIKESIDQVALQEAKKDYLIKRDIEEPISDEQFFESLGITKNGLLTKSGLLFLGKPDLIKQHLGNHEIRFSWKKKRWSTFNK